MPSSDPEPRTGTAPPTPASPYSPALPGVATIDLREDSVRIAPAEADVVRLEFGRHGMDPILVAATDVTRWCAETSLLMRVTFELAGDDEVRVRAPMLVDRQGTALALMRRVTNTGSELVLAIAKTVSDLSNECYSSTFAVRLDEARVLLLALENAAVAAGTSRLAR